MVVGNWIRQTRKFIPFEAANPLDRSGNPYVYTIADSVVNDAGGVLTLTPGYYPYGISLSSGGIIGLTGGPTAIYAFGGGTKRNQATGLILSGGTLRTRPYLFSSRRESMRTRVGTKTWSGNTPF